MGRPRKRGRKPLGKKKKVLTSIRLSPDVEKGVRDIYNAKKGRVGRTKIIEELLRKQLEHKEIPKKQEKDFFTNVLWDIKDHDNDIPLILSGKPKSGKTHLAKRLIKKLKGTHPIIVISPHEGADTYAYDPEDYHKQPKSKRRRLANTIEKYPQVVLDKQFLEKKHICVYDLSGFGISASRQAISTWCDSMIQRITMTKENDRTDYKNLIIIFDEAERYCRDQNFRSFISEARKFFKKVIVIIQNPQYVEDMGYTYNVERKTKI